MSDDATSVDSIERTLSACPECDSPSLESRPGGMNSHGPTRTKYRCITCAHTFDDPIKRPARGSNNTLRGDSLASKLAKANPDDVGIQQSAPVREKPKQIGETE